MLYSGEATMVITRTLEGGEVAFQAGHQAFLGALVENHTRVFQTDGTVQDIAVHRGFVEVHGNPTRVSILSDTAEMVDRHRRRAGQGSAGASSSRAQTGIRRRSAHPRVGRQGPGRGSPHRRRRLVHRLTSDVHLGSVNCGTRGSQQPHGGHPIVRSVWTRTRSRPRSSPEPRRGSAPEMARLLGEAGVPTVLVARRG